MEMQNSVRINRNHKDSSFRYIFHRKDTSSALKKYIDLNNLDIYASKLQHLPVPRYYVFYNGLQEMEDTFTFRLTDSMDSVSRCQSSVEFTAHVININPGHNQELMRRCPILYEYTVFIATIRKYQNQEMTLAEATNLAVDDCIKNGILANILRGHKAEVTDIMLSEYNEALHIATEKEISYQDGYEAGIEDEKQNTAYERQRADEATQRADEATQRADEAIQNAAKTLIALYRKMDMDQAVAASELQSGLHIDTSIAKALLDKYWTN